MKIKSNKFEYHLNVDSWNHYYCSITGTLLNSTQDTFYSNLGDAFDSRFDQEHLTIAYQTDGYFEYHVGNEIGYGGEGKAEGDSRVHGKK